MNKDTALPGSVVGRPTDSESQSGEFPQMKSRPSLGRSNLTQALRDKSRHLTRRRFLFTFDTLPL